jgi:hypothetical protein
MQSWRHHKHASGGQCLGGRHMTACIPPVRPNRCLWWGPCLYPLDRLGSHVSSFDEACAPGRIQSMFQMPYSGLRILVHLPNVIRLPYKNVTSLTSASIPRLYCPVAFALRQLFIASSAGLPPPSSRASFATCNALSDQDREALICLAEGGSRAYVDMVVMS